MAVHANIYAAQNALHVKSGLGYQLQLLRTLLDV